MQASTIKILEVGPRDGLQSVKSIMPTAQKVRWIRGLFEAGLTEIEIGSFVPPSVVPQMADMPEVAQAVTPIEGLLAVALVPNLRGAQRAVEAGVNRLTIPVSVSEAHSRANVRKSRQEMMEEVGSILRWRSEQGLSVRLEAGLSTAFGCSITGPVSEDDVIAMAETLAEMGVDEVGLSDTSGLGNPAQVRRLFTRLIHAIGPKAGAAHMHNTRGLGLANCLAAYDVGVRSFDSSQAGLGGCPFAPGASGNVVTEDLVFMFESMGVRTGVDLDRLIACREILQQGLPAETLYGMTPGAWPLPGVWGPQ